MFYNFYNNELLILVSNFFLVYFLFTNLCSMLIYHFEFENLRLLSLYVCLTLLFMYQISEYAKLMILN